MLGLVQLPQPSQEEEALMCLFSTASCEQPCEILSDVIAEELKAAHTAPQLSIDDWWGCVLLCSVSWNPPPAPWFLSMLSERWFTWHHLFRVLPSLARRPSHCCRWSGLSPCVIRKFDDDIGAQGSLLFKDTSVLLFKDTGKLCVAVQSCVYREYRTGLRTQPCRGTSVEDQGRWGVVAHSDHLTSACQEVQDPAAQRFCSDPESGASQPVWQALWC